MDYFDLDVPESPTDLNLTSTSYSSISLQWKPGFDGGWPQSYWVSLNNDLWRETNHTQFTFTSKSQRVEFRVTPLSTSPDHSDLARVHDSHASSNPCSAAMNEEDYASHAAQTSIIMLSSRQMMNN